MAQNVVEKSKPNRLASTPTVDVLSKLLVAKKKSEENSAEARGTYGKDAVKLREHLFHFDTYRRLLKLDDVAGQDMLPDRQKNTATKANGKAAKVKAGGKKVAKAKGGKAKPRAKAGSKVNGADLSGVRAAPGDIPTTH